MSLFKTRQKDSRKYSIYCNGSNYHTLALLDKKIFAGGIAMLAVGIALTSVISSTMPVGHSGMTEEEALELELQQQESQDYNTLAGILIGIGFLLVLVSFGTRRRRRGGAKKETKKPATS